MENTYNNLFKNNCEFCGDSIYNVGFCDSHCKEYFAKDYTIFNGRKLNGDVRQELEKKDKIIRSLIKNKTK